MLRVIIDNLLAMCEHSTRAFNLMSKHFTTVENNFHECAESNRRMIESLERMEGYLGSLNAQLSTLLEIMMKIRDEIVPDPATSITLDAGPIEEQEK